MPETANPFFISPQNLMPGMQVLGQGVQRSRAKSENQAKLDKQQAIMGSFFDAMDTGDIAQQRAIMQTNPIMMDQFQQMSSLGDDQQDALKNQMASAVINEGLDAAGLEERFGKTARAIGMAQTMSQIGQLSPDQLNDVATQTWMGSEQHKRWLKEQKGGPGGASISAASPKDFTVESMAEFEKTGDRSKLVRHTGAIKKIAGVEHQFNSDTQRWEPLVDMRDSGISEQVAAAAELEVDTEARKDFGKAKTTFQQGRKRLESQITSAENKNKRLVSTANEIKKSLNNWSSKYGASLSALPNSEARRLKGLITTMKANSAFQALTDLKQSGGALGAISGTELDLLEAVFGTLDQGGDNAELVRVLDQIVEANSQSLGIMRDEFESATQDYSGDYDAFSKRNQPDLSDDDLVNKYL